MGRGVGRGVGKGVGIVIAEGAGVGAGKGVAGVVAISKSIDVVEGVEGAGNGVGKGYGCRQRTWQRDLATGPLNLSPAQRSVLSVPLSMSKCWPIVFVEGQIVSGWKHVGVVEGGGKSSLANCRFGISLCCVICLTVGGGMYRRLLIVGFVQRQELEDAVGRGWAGLRRLLLTASQTAMCCSGSIPPVGKV